MILLKNAVALLNGYEVGLIKSEIILDGDHTTIENMLSLASSREEREANIELGATIFTDWLRSGNLQFTESLSNLVP